MMKESAIECLYWSKRALKFTARKYENIWRKEPSNSVVYLTDIKIRNISIYKYNGDVISWKEIAVNDSQQLLGTNYPNFWIAIPRSEVWFN